MDLPVSVDDLSRRGDESALPDPQLTYIARARLPMLLAEFEIAVYRSSDGKEHVTLTLGDLSGAKKGDPVDSSRPAPLVRAHSECLTGDALSSLRCDCGFQLYAALKRIAREGRGALLYLRQEGRGIGLGNKIRAYALQETGIDTVEANHQLGFPADARDYKLAVRMLYQLGLYRIRLMTNNPAKLDALTRDGIEVVERVPLLGGRNSHNAAYLDAKAQKMGHLFLGGMESPKL